jgi:hypothetical protein
MVIIKTLSANVAAKYDLLNIAPGAYAIPGFGIVDLTAISLDKADKLVARGFPYLVLKTPAKAPGKPAVTAEVEEAAVTSATEDLDESNSESENSKPEIKNPNPEVAGSQPGTAPAAETA